MGKKNQGEVFAFTVNSYDICMLPGSSVGAFLLRLCKLYYQ